jgi:hypothetical protein
MIAVHLQISNSFSTVTKVARKATVSSLVVCVLGNGRESRFTENDIDCGLNGCLTI